MSDACRRQPQVGQSLHPRPDQPLDLAPPPQRAEPIPADMAIEGVDGPAVGGNGEVVEEAVHHPLQVSSLILDRQVHHPPDRLLDLPELAAEPLAVVSEIARRHGMSPQHLFTWRRLALRTADLDPAKAPFFVPAVIEAPVEQSAPKRRARRRPSGSGIELEIGGVVVRVGSDASPKAIAAVIRALKAGP